VATSLVNLIAVSVVSGRFFLSFLSAIVLVIFWLGRSSCALTLQSVPRDVCRLAVAFRILAAIITFTDGSVTCYRRPSADGFQRATVWTANSASEDRRSTKLHVTFWLRMQQSEMTIVYIGCDWLTTFNRVIR
jgi:hypothetical protein